LAIDLKLHIDIEKPGLLKWAIDFNQMEKLFLLGIKIQDDREQA
jgi:hypothetical protein